MPKPHKEVGKRGKTVYRVRFRHEGHNLQETFDTKREADAFCSDIETRGAQHALRVLHGRRSFDLGSGGQRWLRGTYLSRDVFASKLHYMPKERIRQAEKGVARTVHDILNDLSGTHAFEALRRELGADVHIGKARHLG